MSKVVLVTGASSGIGLSMATFLAKNGYVVYGASRSAPVNNDFNVVKLDVTDEKNVKIEIDKIVVKNGRIDVLINNAGVGSAGPIEKTPLEDIRKSFELNFFAMVRFSQCVIPHMRDHKYGRIISLSTLGSTIGLPYRAFYSASKGAVDIVTEALRLELDKFGIQACTIHPGEVKTQIANHRIVSLKFDDDTYGKVFKHAFASLNGAIDHGIEPDFFGPFVDNIIKSKKVKRNYYVGTFNEKLGVQLKKYLPYYIYERILKMYFKSGD